MPVSAEWIDYMSGQEPMQALLARLLYRPEAARDAWARTLSFLCAELTPAS